MTTILATHPKATRKIRTLIVEDEPVQREVLRLMLSHEPDVEIVGLSPNGPAALAAIYELGPDLVFLDVELPAWDGFGLVSGIDTTHHRPYFVFLTASDPGPRKVSEAPTLDFLVKPYTRDRFAAALVRARRQLQHGDTRGGV